MKFLIFSFLSMGQLLYCGHELVDIQKINSTIILDIKYATDNNFTKRTVYTKAKCYLLRPVAERLSKVIKELDTLGYKIKIWDGYRPHSVQYIFWDLVPDERYVADPAKGSRHNRGAAIDLTLVKKDGTEVDMGTGFDDFSEKAHRNFTNLSKEVVAHRALLEKIMTKHVFIGLPTEWRHYDFADYENYPLLDISFEELEN